MGKKTKSKARLDKYYHLSKEMGYRSRAAFKLIQLNKKYNFLSGATVLIDLCAAPGGWCQVASKEMPVSSIKIGIDLDPIKPIPGVTTFQCDITTEQCRHLIRKEIKHLKADVVLHDGAPNVGGQWSKDSYNQNELVLFSIKLAVEFLKEGGWFISKVFRSVDYNALIYVMRQLFNKVEATKPLASRTQAAEIFVICQGYKNPSYIDPKLLDPKYALKQIDDEDAMKNNAINSIKAIFDRKKNRSGYNTDTLFIVKTFKDFIECSNPFKFLFETHKIKVETEDCHKYIDIVKKQPPEYKLYFDDLQVLGKKEMEELVIWRNKIRTKLNLSRKEHLKEDEKEEEKETKEEKKEKDINEEMDEEILKYEKQRKKRLEAQKKKQEKIELSNKRAFILQEDQPHDNDVEVDENMFEYIQKNKIDIENLEDPKQKKEDEEDKDKLGDFNEVDLSDLTEDDYIDMMNDDIEQNKKLYEEEKELARKKKKEKNEKKKKKGEIELVKNDNDEDDLSLDKDLDENDEEEENEGDDSELYYDDDDQEDELDEEEENDMPLDESEEEDLKDDVLIKNPLRKEKKKKDVNKDNKENKENKKDKKKEKEEKEEENDEEDNLSYDSDEKEEEKKEKELLNKKKKRSNEKDNISSSDSENDGYNSDDKAEIRAIAKKMLRKKERIKILNASYNRYAFEDDGKVPKWFLDEEAKHNKPQKPITKAEVLAEKEFLKKITVRMPKKVLEAKARKRNRLNKRLQKIKKQAENIANQDEYTEISKVKQIEKLYKREINRSKDKKKYIISRSWSNNKGKDSRNVRHVDRRLKKDKRALKAREKRNKKYKRRH